MPIRLVRHLAAGLVLLGRPGTQGGRYDTSGYMTASFFVMLTCFLESLIPSRHRPARPPNCCYVPVVRISIDEIGCNSL
jgi:hypothetical protein